MILELTVPKIKPQTLLFYPRSEIVRSSAPHQRRDEDRHAEVHWGKNALASFGISLARRSSIFSPLSAFRHPRSDAVTPPVYRYRLFLACPTPGTSGSDSRSWEQWFDQGPL